MTKTKSFAYTKDKKNRVTIIIATILLTLICIVSWIWVRYNTQSQLDTDRELLTILTENLQVKIFSPIESIAGKVEPLLRFEANQTDAQIIEEMSTIERSTRNLESLWIIWADGTVVYPPNLNAASVEERSWWKPYLSKTALPTDNTTGVSGFALSDYTVAQPTRDEMNLSTILPVILRHSFPDGSYAYACMECNLTSILQQQMNEFKVSLGTSDEQVEVIIFDDSGTALETSRNIPIKQVDMPIMNAEANWFRSVDFNSGMIFRQEKSYVSILSRNNTLGLTFCSRIPTASIVRESRKTYFFIFFIASMFISIFVLLISMFMRVTRNFHRYEAMQAQIRFEQLQSHMNPHFLFNTLDSLVGVIEKEEKTTSLKAIKALSFILHFDLRETRHEIPLSEELRYIRYYVQLQRIRYKDFFSFTINMDENFPDTLFILKYCIQPIVENSFVHAVYIRDKIIHIVLNLKIENRNLLISVCNDGPACSEKERQQLQITLPKEQDTSYEYLNSRGKHMGLRNIHQRIRLLYGPAYGISLYPTNQGFRTDIKLPLLTSPKVDEIKEEYKPPNAQ